MINKSIIDSQNVDIDQLLAPIGRTLRTTPNLTLAEGALAYNTTDDRIYYCDGAAYKDISAQSNIAMATFGSTGNAEGATITSPAGANQALQLQPATGTFPGGVSTTEQFFSGIKCFNNGVRMFNLEPLMSPFYNGSGTGSYFMQDQVLNGTLSPMVVNGGGAPGSVPAWHVQKYGRMVSIGLGTSTVVAMSVPGALITVPAGTIPVWARPLSVPRRATCLGTSSGADQVCYVQINVDGSMSFATTAGGVVGFTDPANLEDSVITYTN